MKNIYFFMLLSFLFVIIFGASSAFEKNQYTSLFVHIIILSLYVIFLLKKNFYEKIFNPNDGYFKKILILCSAYLLYCFLIFASVEIPYYINLKRLGFKNSAEYQSALAIGANNKKEYEIRLKEIRIEEGLKIKLVGIKDKISKNEKSKQEDYRASKQRAEQEEINRVQRAEQEERRKVEYEICKKDLHCVAESNMMTVPMSCKPIIESLAQYDYEWTDKWYEEKFSRFKWKDNSRKIVTFIGDKIKFQNGFGAWVNMIYFCDFNIDTREAISAHVQRGRL